MESEFQCATIFEHNLLMFSNYKNATIGKTFIGIIPHAMRFFLAIYILDQFQIPILQQNQIMRL